MATFVTVIHVMTCILLVLVVLIQSGKGAEISASFGGSSQTVFGSSGGANFFVRFTQAMAAIFMVTSVVLTILGAQNRKSLFETTSGASAPVQQVNPQAPQTGAGNPNAPAAPAQPAAPAGNAAAPAQQPAAPAQQPAQR